MLVLSKQNRSAGSKQNGARKKTQISFFFLKWPMPGIFSSVSHSCSTEQFGVTLEMYRSFVCCKNIQ